MIQLQMKSKMMNKKNIFILITKKDMSFDLAYKVELSPKSKEIYEKFVEENKEKKEVDHHDVYGLIAQAASAFASFTLSNGKPLASEQQRQLLSILFDTVVKDESNDFKNEPRLSSVIDTVMKLRDGEFEIDLGSKGNGCCPCFSSLKISTKSKKTL